MVLDPKALEGALDRLAYSAERGDELSSAQRKEFFADVSVICRTASRFVRESAGT